MPSEKKKPETDAVISNSPAKPTEAKLRIATILEQEKIPAAMARGFLAGMRLRPTDRMTLATFQKKYKAWLIKPAEERT